MSQIQPLRILVAEDNENDVLILTRAFSKAAPEASVHFVRDGEEAIAYLGGVGRFADRAAYPLPGLLVVDLKMARMDGFEAIEWVRTKSDLRGMPIAVLSSSGDPCDISRAYRLGANAYHVKPQDPSELIRVVEGWKVFRRTPV